MTALGEGGVLETDAQEMLRYFQEFNEVFTNLLKDLKFITASMNLIEILLFMFFNKLTKNNID